MDVRAAGMGLVRAQHGLFMTLGIENIASPRFSVAQAFTPGFEEAHATYSPLPGGFLTSPSRSPLKGAENFNLILCSQA